MKVLHKSMQTDNFFDTAVLPVADAFRALQVISNEQLLSGLDMWRHPTGHDSLQLYDPDLVTAIKKQPPSKFGPTDQPSVWTGTHFMLALPALSYVMKQYGEIDQTTSHKRFTSDDINRYFISFPYIVGHFQENKEYIKAFDVPSQQSWDDQLTSIYADIQPNADINKLLARLPSLLKAKTNRVLSGKGDSLLGRIVLAYFLEHGLEPEALHLERHTRAYLSSLTKHQAGSYYERLIHAQVELLSLEPFLSTYDVQAGLELSSLLAVVKWFGRSHIVEMMSPGLVGAAEPVIAALLELFAKVIYDGGPDYTRPSLKDLPTVQSFRSAISLRVLGRLSLVKDMLSLTNGEQAADGVIIRRLAMHVFSDAERLKAWGNTDYYVPDSRPTRQSFKLFRQDIGNLLYAAGLVIETENKEATAEVVALKQLATQISLALSVRDMRRIIENDRALLETINADWQIRYPGHERVRQLRFVMQTFGLLPNRPIPISLSELNKSFNGSFLEGLTYHLQYREADSELHLDIELPETGKQTATKRTVTYHTIESDKEVLPVTDDGLPFSAWLEIIELESDVPSVIVPVPGRGSYDPFGRVGNLHAGEVVGFGCSVHHAALSIALAELSSLGAKRRDLNRIKAAFMRINRSVHERRDLAKFQLAQMFEAFETGHVIALSDYLESRKDISYDKKRPYLSDYAKKGHKSIAWAEPQAARLAYGYPDLYPLRNGFSLDPRCTWYDGTCHELIGEKILWQALMAA